MGASSADLNLLHIIGLLIEKLEAVAQRQH